MDYYTRSEIREMTAARDIMVACGSVWADIIHPNRAFLERRHCNSLDALLSEFSNVCYVYHHDTDEYSHIDPDFE